MATIKLNPVFESFSGNIGRIVYYTRFKKVFARVYVKPGNPDTEKQRANRDLFRNAMNEWKGLSSDEKQHFNKRARRLPMTGHNLFVSEYMKKSIAERGITAAETCTNKGEKGYRAYSSSGQKKVSSVYTPSSLPWGSCTASIPGKLPPG